MIDPITPQDLLREREPYHFQRWRSSIHSSYPRPPQPNKNQPNAKIGVKTNNQRDYWQGVYEDYLERRKHRPMEINK